MKINKKAVDFVINTIKTLDKRIEIHHAVHGYIYLFRIKLQENTSEFELNESLMDDFEVAIDKYKGTNYYYTLEYSIKYKIYIALGSNGLIPDFEISSELLNEKGEWEKKPYGYDVSFDEGMCVILNEGLRKSSEFLDRLLAKHGIELKDINAEKRYVDNLIRYNEKHGSFSSEGVGVESLGFLKAAAVREIIDKEKERSQSKIPRVKAEINKEIYKIVKVLRETPFRGVKMPEFIKDYYAASKSESSVAYQIYPPDNLDGLLDRLDPNLRKKRVGAWVTFNSENPDRLSQSANSMVELLDKVIAQLCKEKALSAYLEKKYGTHEETQWIDATRKWISETKDKLNRVKHHTDYRAETLAKTLLENAETIMRVLLE